MSGYGFNGEYYDSATGMLNLRARQYEPILMRFSQRDILRGDLSIPLSLNRYLYCINDPVNFADPSGMIVAKIRLPFHPPIVKPNIPRLLRPEPVEYYTEQLARQEQERLAIGRANKASEDLNVALGNVDRNKLSKSQQDQITAREKELRDKAYDGTLSTEERNSIINEICSIAGVSRENAAKEKALEGASKAIEELLSKNADNAKVVSVFADLLGAGVATAVGIKLNAKKASPFWTEVLSDLSAIGTSAGVKMLWFYKSVTKGGPMDYKEEAQWNAALPGVPFPGEEEQYTVYGVNLVGSNLGNLNYGVVGAALGIPDTILVWQAGAAQLRDHPEENGGKEYTLLESMLDAWRRGVSAYYGDQKDDYENILNGIALYATGNAMEAGQ